MERVEKILILILLLCVMSLIFSFFSNWVLVRLYSPSEIAKITVFHKFAAMIPLVFRVVVHVCIGVWIYGAARKQEASPLAWFVLCVFFGLMGAVLFYLTRIYAALQSERTGAEPI